jgi:hypothetical protein
MTIEEALNRHFVSSGIYAEGCTRDDWYAGHAVYLRLGGWKVPFPILRRSGPIILHDIHHMLTGYPPSWKGEAEVAAWEIASGGCGWHLFYWLDRLSFLIVGLVGAPAATVRAVARGLRAHNLFGRDPEAVLGEDLEEVRAYVGVAAEERAGEAP